jgi:hypothetical protein
VTGIYTRWRMPKERAKDFIGDSGGGVAVDAESQSTSCLSAC